MRAILKKAALLVPGLRQLYAEKLGLEEQLNALRAQGLSSLAQPRLWHDDDAIRKRAVDGKAYAIVCSAGRTATHWIADAFNLHDQIFFSHGPDLEPRKLAPSDGREDVSKRVIRQMGTFDFSNLDAYFDVLESEPRYSVYGNVHGLMDVQHVAQTQPALEVPTLSRRRYYLCTVLRHPIARINSFVHKWLASEDGGQYWIDDFRRRHPELARDFARLDARQALFVKAVHTTLYYDRRYLRLAIPVFQMERLVADVDHFLDFFHQVTAGLVSVDDKYVDAVLALPPRDGTGDQRLTARAIFASWPAAMKTYFVARLSEFDMLRAYEAAGYDLSAVLWAPYFSKPRRDSSASAAWEHGKAKEAA